MVAATCKRPVLPAPEFGGDPAALDRRHEDFDPAVAVEVGGIEREDAPASPAVLVPAPGERLRLPAVEREP